MLRYFVLFLCVGTFFCPGATWAGVHIGIDSVQIWRPFEEEKDFPPHAPPLARMKQAWVKKNFSQCVDLASSSVRSAPDVSGWIRQTQLRCIREYFLDGGDVKKTTQWLLEVPLNQVFQEGPWRKENLENYLQLVTSLVEAPKLSSAKARQLIEDVLNHGHLLNDGQKGDWLLRLAQFLEKENKTKEAAFFRNAAASFRGQQPVANSSPSTEDYQGLEFEFETKIKKAVAEADSAAEIHLICQLQRQLPGSRLAKKLNGRVLEILISASEKGEVPEELLVAALGADPLRLSEWAGQLHRRGFWMPSLRLAQGALETLEETTEGGRLHYIAGRSAHILGIYDKASTHLDRLVQKFGASPEVEEALVRLGLIQFRYGNFFSAAHFFGRAVAQNSENLTAHYWFVRSLEKTDPEKAKLNRDHLIHKFPFSCYGLILRAERDGSLNWGPLEQSLQSLQSKKTTLYLSGWQKEAWKRFDILSRNGWLYEARTELAQIVPGPDVQDELLWSQFLGQRGLFAAAARSLNRSQEKNESTRHPDLIKNLFPRAWLARVTAESIKRKLDPIIVLSLIRQESTFLPEAISSANAIGLMQLVPTTANELARELQLKKILLPEDLFRPQTNIPLGIMYIRKMLNSFENNLPLALAAYNAGPGKLRRFISGRPDLRYGEDEIWYDELPWSETSFYIKSIFRNMILYRFFEQQNYSPKSGFWREFIAKENSTQ
ncbi:MAG: lytic transglycosylase domain-containing protein [Bdellovibrionaceae bacterium]|nr:lytic transglycosylase domain-containing protein [Pseudobdellovibrionaceae bacterium]